MQADIRFASTEDERAAIYRLRYELYVEEQGLFRDKADHGRRWLTDADDRAGRLLLAEVDGKVVGTTRINWAGDAPLSAENRETYLIERFEARIDPRDIVVGTRLLVRSEHRGGALAFQLFWRGFEFAAERNVELALGNCEPHLVGNYRRLGWRPYGGLCNHPTNGVLVRVAFTLGDLDGLRAMRSPVVGALRGRTRGPEAVAGLKALLTEEPAVASLEEEPDAFWGEIERLISADEGGLGALVDGLSRDEAAVLLAKSHLLRCQPGVALIRKDQAARTLYILLAGSLEIVDQGRRLAVVERPGAALGEVAFLTGARRIADVVAGPEGAVVLALSDRVLREIIESHGPVAAKFMTHIARGLSEKLIERARTD